MKMQLQVSPIAPPCPALSAPLWSARRRPRHHTNLAFNSRPLGLAASRAQKINQKVMVNIMDRYHPTVDVQNNESHRKLVEHMQIAVCPPLVLSPELLFRLWQIGSAASRPDPGWVAGASPWLGH